MWLDSMSGEVNKRHVSDGKGGAEFLYVQTLSFIRLHMFIIP